MPGFVFCADGVEINLLQMTKITFLLDESFHFSGLQEILLHREVMMPPGRADEAEHDRHKQRTF